MHGRKCALVVRAKATRQTTCCGTTGLPDRNERRRCDACAERVPARHKRMTKRATCRLGADRELGTEGQETGIARKEAGLAKRRRVSRSAAWGHHARTCEKLNACNALALTTFGEHCKAGALYSRTLAPNV